MSIRIRSAWRPFRFVLTLGLASSLSGGLAGDLETAGAGDGVIPAFDPGRYEVLWERSPFGIDTAPVAVATNASFADGLVISGIVRGEGQESVTLVDTRTRKFFRATKKGGGDFELVSLSIDRDRRKSWALIGRGGETAEVRFPEPATKPVGKGMAVAAGEVAGRESRQTVPRPGAGPASPASGRVSAGGGAAPAGRIGRVASGERAATPPRRRVILPRQR